MLASSRSALSPAAWPWVSLICLKWSMSSTTSAHGAAIRVGARELGLEPLLEGAAVERAGQRVLGGEVAQLRDEAVDALAQHQHDAVTTPQTSATAMNIASRSPGSTHAASATPQHSSANAKFAAISARGRK